MWLLALRSETTHDSESAALLWDLKQYFEHIDREVLRQEAEETQFPQYVLEMAVTAYQAQRVITMRGLACRVGHSKVGGTAGCPIITTLIQVYTMRALAAWVSHNPSVGLMVYVDDFTLKGRGRVDHRPLYHHGASDRGHEVHPGAAAARQGQPREG